MTSSKQSTWLESLRPQLAKQQPFSLLTEDQLSDLLSTAKLRKFTPGQRIIRPAEFSDSLFLVIKGTVRLIVIGNESEGQITLGKRGSGQLLGWSSLLRGKSCEFVQASTETYVFSLSAKTFLELIFSVKEFADYYSSLASPQESYEVLVASGELQPKRSAGWRQGLINRVNQVKVVSVQPGDSLSVLPKIPANWQWIVSTPDIPGNPVGTIIGKDLNLPQRQGYKLPYRLLAVPIEADLAVLSQQEVSPEPEESSDSLPVDLRELGIMDDEELKDDIRFPFIRGHGQLKETMAALEMVALQQAVPFRKDQIQKALEDQFRRDKTLSIELIAALSQILGLNAQVGEVSIQHLLGVETPIIFLLEDVPVVLFDIKKGSFFIGHPHHGILRKSIEDLKDLEKEKIRFALPKRLASTPTSRFGWNWFTPLIRKYKTSLILVFIASLLAQMFGLAIPLLLQQIIDKVLTQGNLSSLNVLGTAMIVMALFQGVLMALRTYIFVDTTDRMDLTLGSAVIDRLLALPLSYFERRPVGELSQRLGELNSIRSFLTGTALVSVLNIIFSAIYLLVMLLYSPLLTAVALSTLPLYLLLIFIIAPIYRSLIRRRAVAQAKTQSHLIEILGGIQTVKAQHFELTARWKWQDRYRKFVDEGFKSVALGASSGEIGKFLNQVSSVGVLWVGMYLVLQGEFTLGMLIAFRIIAGNVTGPLLQLAGLYQGFQKVQLSMERLSDIIDQNPELQNSEEIGQIALPPIQGDVRFENVDFRFGSTGPNQLNDVSIDISKGSFVGIVGQSGSGKSTLMKLLPRLYKPAQGRIFVDDYDIGKVDLSSLRRQIGIVPQDSLLFEGTVGENIALNDPQASTEAIIDAAKLSCAHDFIMSLGQGYATPLAERGSNLSGGQRQRLAIARTILSNPQLLVMDEATSALDYDTERQLCLNLQNWAGNRTVFFITHRLSTIKNSDLIMVMHQGRLEEVGKHDELMSKNGRYKTLYRQQEASG